MRSSRLPLLLLPAVVLLNGCAGSKSARIYDIGSRVEVGHLIYTIFETQWLPQMGAGDNRRVPKHRFFLVRLTVVNSGSEELDVPNMSLVDDQGGVVEEMPDGTDVPQWIGFVRRAKPADSISGNVIFDAEPKHYRLRITDENGEKYAQVDIPLNFNADTAPPPLPAAPVTDSGAQPKK